jgi:hypothetical protein
MMQQYHINTHSEWKPLVQNHRSEKDTRHCDAEKARRDHQSAYIDLGFSLRKKFMWPEDLDGATSRDLNGEATSSPGSSFNSTSTSSTSAGTSDQCDSKERMPSRKEKLTKQTKLHQQVLWEFRACLRIDKERVREWLDDVREQGEELRRRKREVIEGAWEVRGRKGKVGKEIRCSKDEAVLEVWEVMEREFCEFCCAETGGAEVDSVGVCGSSGVMGGRKRRGSGDETGDGEEGVKRVKE